MRLNRWTVENFSKGRSELVCWVTVLMAQFGLSEVEALLTLSKAYANVPDHIKPLKEIKFQ